MADEKVEGPDRKSREEAALRRAVINMTKLRTLRECIIELDVAMDSLMVAGGHDEEVARLQRAIGFLARIAGPE